MKKIVFILGLLLTGFGSLAVAPTTDALGLKIAPLQYKTTLKEKERQVGVIDISNPSGQTVKVKTSVQAFKQTDNSGGLQFYDDEQTSKGIKNDLNDFELGPHEALRMSFTIDGAQLPEGDVYAAIFFTTEPAIARNGVGELVRVGTILSIVNKTPGPRSADVTKLSIPFFQLSDTVDGTYRIKNSGAASSGFYPKVTVSAWPAGKAKQIDSTLVFGGRERSNDFRYETGFGIHFVEVEFRGSKKGQWVITTAPWMLIITVMILLITGVELLLFKRRRKIVSKITDSTS